VWARRLRPYVLADANLAVLLARGGFGQASSSVHRDREDDVGHVIHRLRELRAHDVVRGAFAFGLRNVHQSHVDGRVAAANVAAGVIALRCSASQRWLSVTRLAVHVSLEPRGRDALLAL